MTEQKLVGIYTRVSTQDQSCEMQLSDLRKYCEQRGFTIFKEYSDWGISGAKEKRPALDELMEDMRKRRFDAVLVWRFDRFSRSTKQLVMALEEFQHLGVDFISYQENIDTSSTFGKAIFTVISAIAELERNIITERIKGGIRTAKEKGKKLGRPKELNLDIQELLRLKKEGWSVRKIAIRVNASSSAVQKIFKKRLAPKRRQISV